MIRPKHPRYERQLAFTLGELLLVLALLGTLVGLGTQPLLQMVTQHRQQAVLAQLRNTLQHARAQAVLGGDSVELCGSAQAEGCDDDWAAGWTLHRPAQNEVLLHHRLATREPLRWSGFARRVRFLPNGTSPTGNGRFYQCRSGKVAWQLVLNRQGRLKTTTPQENSAKAELCTPPTR
ncbi:GspH/FimT family protein [Pseudomonas sp. ABC1]|uniref:GspH/FimT family protein n=1 Tax=Pseudomonas sp. ABC1 TaxID=2748080 RepID=UPI0015C2DAFB|nr:GspH/FimT family protein [Pseudomonas sp. ABC1]QLF92762.1 GspH/FimT family protein [Pseudomonas sp. ABC1]